MNHTGMTSVETKLVSKPSWLTSSALEPYRESADEQVSQLATVANIGENRWVVHMGSPSDSRVTVEVNMSLETAKRIAEKETERIATLNPGRDDIKPESVGSAVMSVLGLFATGGTP